VTEKWKLNGCAVIIGSKLLSSEFLSCRQWRWKNEFWSECFFLRL